MTMYFPSPSPPQSPLRTMWLSSSPSDSPSPPISPSPLTSQVHDLSNVLSSLEDDTAYLENYLYTLKYNLQVLDAGARDTGFIQSRALHLLGELENAEAEIEKLSFRLGCLSGTVDSLETDCGDNELRKQYVMIDESLAAADQMRKEMKGWADTVYFGAYDLEAANGEELKGRRNISV